MARLTLRPASENGGRLIRIAEARHEHAELCLHGADAMILFGYAGIFLIMSSGLNSVNMGLHACLLMSDGSVDRGLDTPP